MATITRQEILEIAYSDLTKINAAIDMLLEDKRVERLEIGSHEFRRVYDKGKAPSLTELFKLRRQLLEYIDSLEETTQVAYREGASVPLIVNRRF